MKGDDKVIKALNEVLKGELTAINQYFLHARTCQNWGYERIAKKIYDESIDEMKHAQTLTDRILFLEGLPNLQNLDALRIGQNVKEILDCDLELEKEAIPRLRESVKLCEQVNDYGTREILEHILTDEEEHVDWIEAQLGMVEEIGIQNYLSEQIRKEE